MGGIAVSNAMPESIVEQSGHDWLRGLGYEALFGLKIAPGKTVAEVRR